MSTDMIDLGSISVGLWSGLNIINPFGSSFFETGAQIGSLAVTW